MENKKLLASFEVIASQFIHGPETYKIYNYLFSFLWWANEQPLLLSSLGGQIGFRNPLAATYLTTASDGTFAA